KAASPCCSRITSPSRLPKRRISAPNWLRLSSILSSHSWVPHPEYTLDASRGMLCWLSGRCDHHRAAFGAAAQGSTHDKALWRLLKCLGTDQHTNVQQNGRDCDDRDERHHGGNNTEPC